MRKSKLKFIWCTIIFIVSGYVTETVSEMKLDSLTVLLLFLLFLNNFVRLFMAFSEHYKESKKIEKYTKRHLRIEK